MDSTPLAISIRTPANRSLSSYPILFTISMSILPFVPYIYNLTSIPPFGGIEKNQMEFLPMSVSYSRQGVLCERGLAPRQL
ncbi:hypothetical protein Y032_0224g2723 [Ancylostoma ceylanicum]|uniref:Uncharacterized protein n=1 Tax=Ancylostoma ceylanicum TaxID=53326 RepID=A0A016SI63_9BILA|nr:hypothetical protein Y032_0224g2723 [Ancylostoma ceylanicum]